MAHEFGLNYLFVFALLVGTLQGAAGLQPFLEEVGAAVEGLAALGAPLHDFAFGALRALHANGFLLDVFASWIIAARRKLAETAIFHDQIVAALRAFFVQRDVGFLLGPADGTRGFA